MDFETAGRHSPPIRSSQAHRLKSSLLKILLMKIVVWGLVVLLLVLHQDNWLWDNDTLVFGFVPMTLLFHAGISVAAGMTWFLATKFAWPTYLEDPSGSEGGSH